MGPGGWGEADKARPGRAITGDGGSGHTRILGIGCSWDNNMVEEVDAAQLRNGRRVSGAESVRWGTGQCVVAWGGGTVVTRKQHSG